MSDLRQGVPNVGLEPLEHIVGTFGRYAAAVQVSRLQSIQGSAARIAGRVCRAATWR